MIPERSLRQLVIKKINKLEAAECMAVENHIVPGTPDLNGIYKHQEFWIEFKVIKNWGKIHHFTPQQKIWMLKRGSIGGKVFLLVKKERLHKLFTWKQAMVIYELGVKSGSDCVYQAKHSIDVTRMLEVIINV